jgi:hypothetical protein
MAGFLEALASVLEMGIPGSFPIAHTFALQSIYPNPFNSRCTVRFNVMGDEKVTLVIYDLLGRKVRTLVHDFLPAGEQTVIWDGKDTFGVPRRRAFTQLISFRENSRPVSESSC